MKTLEPDWQRQQPNAEAVRTMWNKIRFENIPITHPELLQFVHDLKVVHTYGGALLYHFQISENVTFDWFAYRNRLEEIGFINRMLRSGDVVAAGAELSIDQGLVQVENVIALPDGFDFGGRLARHLFHGGPHNSGNFSAEEALIKARNFVQQIFQNRYEEVSILIFDEAWAGWFYDEQWDITYLVYDRRFRQIWLLCLTDTE